jgi:hypothetical protein
MKIRQTPSQLPSIFVLSAMPTSTPIVFFANAAALLGGLAALFNTNLFPGFSQKGVGIVYLLLLPLGLGNLDVGQANPLVVGMLMFAIAAVRVKRWNIAALCVAIPTFLKYTLSL